MSNNRVESVERALIILECFNQQKKSMTLTEIALATGMYKSTVLRLASSLERFNFLIRSPDGQYRIGQSLWRLGQLYQSDINIEQSVRSELKKLVTNTRETASFYIREADFRVCLYRENSVLAARHHLDEGTTLPINNGASGHVLLAFTDTETELTKYNKTRELKYAISLGERDPSIAAIAVPVFSGNNTFIGALALSGIVTRFTQDHQDNLLKELKEAAIRLKTQIAVY